MAELLAQSLIITEKTDFLQKKHNYKVALSIIKNVNLELYYF